MCSSNKTTYQYHKSIMNHFVVWRFAWDGGTPKSSIWFNRIFHYHPAIGFPPWDFLGHLFRFFFPSEGAIHGNPHISIHHIDHSTMNRYCRSCANIVHHIYFHYESLSPYFWNPMAESHMSYGFILGAIYHVFHRIGWWENLQESPTNLMVKTMVSCKFSLKPSQWMF